MSRRSFYSKSRILYSFIYIFSPLEHATNILSLYFEFGFYVRKCRKKFYKKFYITIAN